MGGRRVRRGHERQPFVLTLGAAAFHHQRDVFRREADELEKLLARAASLRDQDERLRTYRDFERIWIGEQAAVVPIAYADEQLWRRPWVTGMWVNATEISTFAHAVVRRPQPAPRRG